MRAWIHPAALDGDNGRWDGSRDDGSAARSGVYFLLVEAPGTAATTKIVVAR